MGYSGFGSSWSFFDITGVDIAGIAESLAADIAEVNGVLAGYDLFVNNFNSIADSLNSPPGVVSGSVMQLPTLPTSEEVLSAEFVAATVLGVVLKGAARGF